MPIQPTTALPPKALTAFAARDDLTQYGSSALLLFTLQLKHGIDDIASVASVALTDGANDKKCDLVYVDRGAERVILAQGYYSSDESRGAAPANKASDLNTAASWLISGDLSIVPDNLRSAAQEVRDALTSNNVSELEIWYSHNLPESQNVKDELAQAARTADGLIKRHFPETKVNCSSQEIGLTQLEDLYRRAEAPIAVTETFELTVDGGFEVTSQKWNAFTTSVPATWLRDVWLKHKADLMSPNVRDYLGIVKSESNINNGIKTTATETPGEFWIYNNGLTVLVHSYVADGPDATGKWKLQLTGLGIVNGAQTTGSIGTLASDSATNLAEAHVLTRFVTCDDSDVLGDIVKFNNTQNKVEAADFRSKDPVQQRLRAEFTGIPDADYRGGRRGGVKAAIERFPNLLADQAVAQALAAFHGEPNLAYNETRKIWVEDGTYAKFYSDRTTARHIVFAYALLRSIEATKKRLSDLAEVDRTEAQKRQMDYFRRRGSHVLLLAAISSSIETFLGRPVPDRWALTFRDNCSATNGVARWQPIVDAALAFADQLSEATDLGLKNPLTVGGVLSTFGALILATADANQTMYGAFSKFVAG